MSDRNVIQEQVAKFAAALGMTKRSGSWYRHTDSLVTLLNLQKSQYGPSYHINVGFWLDELGAERYPKENQAHIRIRLDRLLGEEEADRVRKLLDLDVDIVESDRRRLLGQLLLNHLRPVLEQASSVEGLRELYANGTLIQAAVRVAAQEALT